MATQPQQPNAPAPKDDIDWQAGQGRKDVTGKTPVYPASGPERPPSGHARVQPMGTFGGGNYNESGSSEIIPPRGDANQPPTPIAGSAPGMPNSIASAYTPGTNAGGPHAGRVHRRRRRRRHRPARHQRPRHDSRGRSEPSVRGCPRAQRGPQNPRV